MRRGATRGRPTTWRRISRARCWSTARAPSGRRPGWNGWGATRSSIGARVEQRRAELAPEIEPPPPPADPETALLARERRGLVRRALALLPRPQRRAALLRFHGELPFQTVAARLGTPEVTARTRVQRALTSLRARLGSLRAIFFGAGDAGRGAGADGGRRQLPAQPGPLAMADDDVISERPARGPCRLSRTPRRRGGRTGEGGQGMEKAPPDEARQDVTTYSAVQRFKFETTRSSRTCSGPDDIRILITRPADQPSLIEIRQHFVPEMVKSLEEY